MQGVGRAAPLHQNKVLAHGILNAAKTRQSLSRGGVQQGAASTRQASAGTSRDMPEEEFPATANGSRVRSRAHTVVFFMAHILSPYQSSSLCSATF